MTFLFRIQQLCSSILLAVADMENKKYHLENRLSVECKHKCHYTLAVPLIDSRAKEFGIV